MIEFQSKIIEANNIAFEAQEERAAFLQHISDLEKQVADFKAWDAEKKRYILEALAPEALAFAYVLKADAEPSEPPHWLCAKCYQEGKKSILQLAGKGDPTGRLRAWGCSRQRMTW